jgi:SAM-dependent methyltransferase
MDSQSGYCLPIIYQPFDTTKRTHWADRGALFDFLVSTEGQGKRLLDLGPGDGWPSLILAPFVREIVGVEGSRRRVEVCRRNAGRLGITNAEFVYVEPGSPLPFGDGSFDGATAASSVEQTPSPKFTLRELHRILKPGGRLRTMYEDLDRYRNGKEHDVWLQWLDSETSKVILYDRDIESEQATMYGITLSMPEDEVIRFFSGEAKSVGFDDITPELLRDVHPRITEASVCTLSHPSGRTLVGLLTEVGFSEVLPTQSGVEYARQLFDRLPEEERPEDMGTLDDLLRTRIEAFVRTPAPIGLNPPITAVK